MDLPFTIVFTGVEKFRMLWAWMPYEMLLFIYLDLLIAGCVWALVWIRHVRETSVATRQPPSIEHHSPTTGMEKVASDRKTNLSFLLFMMANAVVDIIDDYLDVIPDHFVLDLSVAPTRQQFTRRDDWKISYHWHGPTNTRAFFLNLHYMPKSGIERCITLNSQEMDLPNPQLGTALDFTKIGVYYLECAFLALSSNQSDKAVVAEAIRACRHTIHTRSSSNDSYGILFCSVMLITCSFWFFFDIE